MQHDKVDDADLSEYGYEQKLSRAIGGYTAFALSFSMVTITTTIFTLFADPFTKLGGVGIWLWLPVTAGVLMLTLVYGHLAARMPVTGYAYQWSSRLVGRHYGALVGWVTSSALSPLLIRSDVGGTPLPPAVAAWPWGAGALLVLGSALGALAISTVLTAAQARFPRRDAG